jgi:hypothetical protein
VRLEHLSDKVAKFISKALEASSSIDSCFLLCRYLTSKPTKDTPKVVDCKWGIAEITNSKVQGIRNFRQVWTTESVISYVLCGGLYCHR